MGEGVGIECIDLQLWDSRDSRPPLSSLEFPTAPVATLSERGYAVHQQKIARGHSHRPVFFFGGMAHGHLRPGSFLNHYWKPLAIFKIAIAHLANNLAVGPLNETHQ